TKDGGDTRDCEEYGRRGPVSGRLVRRCLESSLRLPASRGSSQLAPQGLLRPRCRGFTHPPLRKLRTDVRGSAAVQPPKTQNGPAWGPWSADGRSAVSGW